jgi:hypothetical protein
MLIPVGQWLPDQPEFGNAGCIRAFNVLPGADTYQPMPTLTLKATGSTGQINGSINARDQANNNYTYCGDTSAIYVQAGVSLNAATKISSTYAVANGDAWEFIQWGQTVIASNGTDPMQQISLGAANFVDLSGGPPKARHIAVINNFVVAGNISDSSTQVQRVRWCGINNVNAWSQDATTLADLQDLPGEGGWVQKIVGGEQGGFIFQERKIWAMNFVGSPLIFQFNPVHQNIGAYAAQGVASYENVIFFLSASGFYQFDGTNLKPIGQGRVDETFLADLDSSNVANVRAAIWPEKKVVAWAYPGSGNNQGRCNRIMIYSWQYDRWSRLSVPSQFDSGAITHLALTSTPGVTLEGLDTYGTLETLPFSMDDRSWTGGALIFSAFSGGSLYYFTGLAMAADVETSEMNLQQAMYRNADDLKLLSQVNEIWPIVDGVTPANLTVAIGYRDKLTDTVTYEQATSPNDDGFIEARTTSRYFRFRIQTDGNSDYNFIQGVDVAFEGGGRR